MIVYVLRSPTYVEDGEIVGIFESWAKADAYRSTATPAVSDGAIVEWEVERDSDRTRPVAIVREVETNRSIADASVAELLTVCIARAQEQRQEGSPPNAAGREFSIAITHMEDAITRFNKGFYMLKGTFAISDAERS